MSTLKNTADFMYAAGQHIPAAPALPSADIARLRVALLQEELDELHLAFHDKDLVGVLDALADLQVVLDGAVLACGMQEVFPAAMAEVHRSNMSKFLDSPSQAHDEAEKLRQAGISVRVEGSALCLPYALIRRSDGKLIKPSTYSPANLAPLLS